MPLRIGATHVGRGVFATEPYRRGQRITAIRGRIVAADSVTEDHFELDPRHALLPHAPCRYLNHSCEPNAEVVHLELEQGRHRLLLEAVRPIRAGEEITIDYGFSAEDAIPCACGTSSCRGWIVAQDELARIAER